MSVQVNGNGVSVRFDANGGGPVLSSIQLAGSEWITAGGGEDLWKAWLCGPDGTAPMYAECNGDFEGAEKEGDGVVLRWSLRLGGGRQGIIEARIDTAGEALSEWRLKVELPSGWVIKRADFPRIGALRPRDEMKVLAPVGLGIDYPFRAGFSYEGRYPSWTAVMQFMGVHDGGGGLYMAAHDGEAHLKNLCARHDEFGRRVFVTHWPALSNVFDQPYPVVIGVYTGGMDAAANTYREFAVNTRWGKAAAARRIPEWLLDTHLWLRPDGAPEKVRGETLEGLEYFDVPTALHWYRWHEIPYDTRYPEYFPPLPGFAETIAEFQSAGSHVTPYINGRLWDPASESWRKKNAAASAARKDNGECYSEIYGSKIPNTAMCPATPLWRDTVADLVERLVKECGVHGVYIDQIGCAAGVPCYSTEHEHEPGGGSFWASAYRQLADKARTRLPEDGILTTEECAECWIDQFDGLLTVNTPSGDYDIVPLFPLVYSDRTVLIGNQYYTKDEPSNSLSWRLKCARTLLWGAQLGWIQPDRILAEKREAEFLRTLARARREARSFVYTRFLGPAKVEGDVPMLEGSGSLLFGPGSYPIKTPAVLATRWEGNRWIVVNMADEDVRCVVDGNDVLMAARGAKVIAGD